MGFSRDGHERLVIDIDSQEKRETIWVFGRKHVGAINWGRTIAFGICVLT